MDEIVLEVEQKIEYLRLATTLAREVCRSIKDPRVDQDFINTAELVVSEACTNAILHGKPPGGCGRVATVFQVFQDKIVIHIKDKGPGFDITGVPLPDFDRHPEGGYGLYIIRTKMHEVRYSTSDGWNMLSMTLYFEGRASAS
jgi:serine/threonine-protein kinase RsbW